MATLAYGACLCSMKICCFLLFLPVLAGCGQHGTGGSTGADSTGAIPSRDSATVATAKDAYLYGLPLVLMDISRRQMTATASNPAAVPVNTFKNLSEFPNASFRDVVRPNADTYYSTAWLDLRSGPLVLSVPDTRGRYYMLPMLDAWTNVFASPGKRTTGTGSGNFLIAGPKWTGQVPPGMHLLKSPTNMVWIIGRTQVNSKADGLAVVVPIQKRFRLTALNSEGRSDASQEMAPDPNIPKGTPNEVLRRMPVDSFFTYLNRLMVENPPSEADKAAINRFGAIGVGPGARFEWSSFPADVQAALRQLPERVLDEMSKTQTQPPAGSNGWTMTPHTGSYGVNYPFRAFVAYFGLGANLSEDAIYPSCSFDNHGQPLNGSNRYVMHFDKGQTPPSRAFWSLTLYDPDGYMIVNPIDRNAIGDRSALLQNPDGSIDIYIQHSDPGGSKQRNWLPAPAGDFNLLLRVYWPRQEMIDGSWTVPAVKKQS